MRFRGDATGPVGAYAPVDSGDDRLVIIVKDERIKVLAFEVEAERDERIAALDRAFGIHQAGLTQEEVVAAVFGYQNTAEWAANLDGYGHGWTEEAQHATSRDVTQFLIDNVQHLRTYLDTVKEEWPHAGAQFYRSRNGELGFASDAAGETVNALLDAAQGAGPQRVHLAESGEIEIESSQGGTGSRES
jgi:hypothetical protein